MSDPIRADAELRNLGIEIPDSPADERSMTLRSELAGLAQDLRSGRTDRATLRRAEQALAEASDLHRQVSQSMVPPLWDRMQELQQALGAVRERAAAQAPDAAPTGGGAAKARRQHDAFLTGLARSGLREMARTGAIDSFVGAFVDGTDVLGGREQRALRVLSRVPAGRMESILRAQGVGAERARELTDALGHMAARAVDAQTRRLAAQRIGALAERLEQAALGGGPAFDALLRSVQGPKGAALLEAMERAGAGPEVAVLRRMPADPEALEEAMGSVRRALADAAGKTAERLAEAAAELRDGGRLSEQMWGGAVRQFPAARRDVLTRLGATGRGESFVERAVSELARDGRAHDADIEWWGIAVGIAASFVSLGAAGLAASALVGAGSDGLDAAAAHRALDRQVMAHVAGATDAERVEQARDEAETRTVMVGVNAAAAVAGHRLGKALERGGATSGPAAQVAEATVTHGPRVTEAARPQPQERSEQ